MYDPEQVRPMWEELARVGIRPATTPEDVDSVLGKKEGTALCVVNSVCGCAAGNARPGAMLALQNETIPDDLITVFAGMDTEAVAQARGYMAQVPPSSPCIALFKDGAPIFVMERRHIEQMTAIDIANHLVEAFNKFCARKGPSVPREVYESEDPVHICGSTVDRVDNA
jgi:putative YphP/YqiW family bacilliredoxin